MIFDLMAAGAGTLQNDVPTLDVTDLFCGAGGGTDAMREAAELLGFQCAFTLVNHLPIAIETIRANFPRSRPFCNGVDEVGPFQLYPARRGLDALIGGPSCTEYSSANTVPIEQFRSTPWCMYEWAEALQPPLVTVENVKQFPKRWPDFAKWVKAFERLGYRYGGRVFNAADYGDATTRERLFMLFVKAPLQVVFPDPTHSQYPDGRLEPWVPASTVIDWTIKGRWLDEMPGKPQYGGLPLSPNTMRRIFSGLRISGLDKLIVEWDNISTRKGWRLASEPLSTMVTKARHGLAVPYLEPMVLPQHGGGVLRPVSQPLPTITCDGAIGFVESFLVKYYGTAGAVSVRKPMPTITTKDRFALCCPVVKKDGEDHRLRVMWRMLRWHELAAAMSFRKDYHFHGTNTERTLQVGNAWPHKLARAILLAVLSQQSDVRPFLRKAVTA